MARFYLSGRSRVLRAENLVTVMAVGSFGSSTYHGALDSTTGWTLVFTPDLRLSWRGYSSAFGIEPAYGSRTVSGSVQTALGFRLPNGGFLPIVEATGSVQTITADVTIIRNVTLIESFAHSQNGRRSEVFGAAGTCYETYSGAGLTHTTKDDSFGFVPGQSPSAFNTFGFQQGAVAFTRNGYDTSVSPWAPWTVGDMTCTWTWRLVDSSGGALFAPPGVPSEGSNAGHSEWGSVVAYGPPLPPASPSSSSLRRRSVGMGIAYVPRYAFEIEMSPLAIPDVSPVAMHHRLEIWKYDPLSGGSSSSGTTYNTSGETVSLPCGGTKWDSGHHAQYFDPLSALYLDDATSFTHHYNDLLPLVTKIQVTSSDAQPHYFCHVRAPWDALSLSQASAVTVPGGAGLSVAVGTPHTLSLGGAKIGYRYLRVSAKTPTGTGTLTIQTYLNGDTASHTASKSLTTTVANTPVTVTIDMLEVAGCTYGSELELEQIVFTAAGNDFTIETLELVRTESLVQSLGSARALFPLAMPFLQPWLYGITDGVISLSHLVSGSSVDGTLTIASMTLLQLVQEINGTTRHSYGSWTPAFPFVYALGSAAPTPSPYLGWVATDLAPARVGKGYSADEVYEPEDWSDSDAYLPALHGDGIIGTSLCLANSSLTIQAQRFSTIIEPGIMPGDAGFDGTAGSAFGGDAEDLHAITRVRFVGLFRGAVHGMEVGALASLPIKETDDIIPASMGGGTTPIVPPVPVGSLVPRASGFSLSSKPLRGDRGNGYKQSIVFNAGGTPADMVVFPYNRERVYGRFWPVAGDPCAIEHDAPRGWLHIAQDVRVNTYWREDQGPAGQLVSGFEGEDLDLDSIKRLQTITGGRLLVLGAAGSSYKLLLSGDGGKTAVEVLEMEDAASALVGYDGVRNWIVVWWEDSTTHQVKRKVSRDGGASWETEQDVQWTPTGGSLEDLEAELLDVKFVRELAGRFAMVVLPQGSSDGVVIVSGDGGFTWSQVL